jgi:NAD(P)-dependent dehydrogenase (short-subunit alcohol dehydrogenase family)
MSDFERSFSFVGKVALITGAAAGIGRAIADLFSERGATLGLVDRNPTILEIADNYGAAHRGWAVDVADEEAVKRLVADAATHFGSIDILINNAGIGPLAPAESYSTPEWDRTMSVNLRAPFVFAREVAPHMFQKGKGRIVSIASQAAVVGIQDHVAYCASKAGLLGMTNVMALEWGPRGVTVNAISPTVVETELGLISWAGERGDRARAEIPTRRFAQPSEIAMAALYLASDAADMVNGANLMIDGGFTIR